MNEWLRRMGDPAVRAQRRKEAAAVEEAFEFSLLRLMDQEREDELVEQAKDRVYQRLAVAFVRCFFDGECS